MLLNKDRAYQVMDKYRLSGLVAVSNHNIYYVTDYWESMTDFGWPFLDYAVLPRNESAPAALVLPSIKLDKLSVLPTWVPNTIAFSDYSGREARADDVRDPLTGEPRATPWTGWAQAKNATLTPREMEWAARTAAHATRMTATSAWGLCRALKDAGLTKGRIGSDDPRVLHWMKDMGLPDIEPVDATNIFREIRMIKSKEEVENLRRSGANNEEAARLLASRLHEDANWAELDDYFHMEVARRGNRHGHIVAELGGFRHGRIVADEPMFFDSASTYRHYWADFGRTVVIGDPPPLLLKRYKAMLAGWEVACEYLRPGVRRSTLINKAIEATQKAGFPEYFYVSPHSIGLEHTDSPVPFGPALYSAENDYVFEENMVINVDFPYTEWGWGSMHLEDTLHVTATGFDPLTSMKNELIILPRSNRSHQSMKAAAAADRVS